MPRQACLLLNTPVFTGRTSVRRVFPSTAGRLACQTGPSQYSVQLKPAPGMRWPSLGLRPSFARLVAASLAPRCVGPDRFDCAPPYPRGPRSGSGYRVPIHHHLVGPIRPARRHIVISPPSGLYAMPSLCGSASATRERFRAFAARSFLACRPLGPRGARSSSVPDQRCRRGLRHE